MKKLIARALLSFTMIMYASANGRDSSLDSVEIDRMAGLCRLWGAVKYFHPYLAYKDINWDSALITSIPRIDKAKTAEEYKHAIQYMLSFLQDPNTCVIDGSDTRRPARIIHQFEDQPYLITAGDGIDIVVATDYTRFLEDTLAAVRLKELFLGVTVSQGAIIDIRRLDAGGPKAARAFTEAFLAAFPVLLNDDLPFSSSRRRIHVGYPSQAGDIDTAFFSALEYKHGRILKAAGTGVEDVPLVLIVNESSYGLVDFLGGVQAAQRAAIVHEGYFDLEAGLQTYEISLPDSIVVRMRMNELVKIDGTGGIHPDLVLPYVIDTTLLDCPPVQLALKILSGNQTVPPAVGVELSPAARVRYEDAYEDMVYPSREYRFLALFRVWNVIRYFHSAQAGRIGAWDKFLRSFIREMDDARDSLEYNLALARLTAKLHDNNARIESSVLNDYYGFFYPPFVTRHIENRTVVTHVFRESAATDGRIQVGDIILAIDGRDIGSCRERMKPYLAVPNSRGLESRVDSLLLGGRKGSSVSLTIQRADADTSIVVVTRSIRPRRVHRHGEESRMIDGEVAYIDLTRISPGCFDSLMNIYRGTPALILDLRGDCRIPLNDIAAWFVDDTLMYAEIIIPQSLTPDLNRQRTIIQPLYAAGGPGGSYDGKLAVLTGANSTTRAEEICMMLIVARRPATVGSATSGHIGEVTSTVLPGGITVFFTGAEYRYPNGNSVSRTGIDPLVSVEPTIQGIREGRDEALEVAVEYLVGGE